MLSRVDLRKGSADYLNSFSPDELFGLFSITRIARIDGLDQIGVPVYSAVRPAGKIISVTAGKSMDRALARAGAIAEGIEYHIFENPGGSFEVGTTEDLGFPLRKGSTWTPETPICLEPVVHLKTGRSHLFPSQLLWLVNRGKENTHYFQKSSNGQATGATLCDALLQALLECIERDQVTLRRISLQDLGIYPPRVRIPQSCDRLQAMCRSSSLSLFLFLCNVDIPIPVYWAILCDHEWQAFAGWGCDLNQEEAATRAILEAIQSRAVYIAGARDDIERRYVDHSEQKALIRQLSALPGIHTKQLNYDTSLTAQDELSKVLRLLGPWSDRIYYKEIPVNERLVAVKVCVLGFEQPIIPARHGWQAVRWHKLKEKYEQTLQMEQGKTSEMEILGRSGMAE